MLKKKEKYIVSFAIIFFLIILISILFTQNKRNPENLDFELPLIDSNGLKDQSIKLSDFKGNVILLEFSVEWCPHCNNMAPIIKEIHENYKNKGLVVITVMLSERTNEKKTADFIKKHDSNWIHVYDTKGIYKNFGVSGTPTYFIIDKEFKIKEKIEGEVSYFKLEKTIIEYL